MNVGQTPLADIPDLTVFDVEVYDCQFRLIHFIWTFTQHSSSALLISWNISSTRICRKIERKLVAANVRQVYEGCEHLAKRTTIFDHYRYCEFSSQEFCACVSEMPLRRVYVQSRFHDGNSFIVTFNSECKCICLFPLIDYFVLNVRVIDRLVF